MTTVQVSAGELALLSEHRLDEVTRLQGIIDDVRTRADVALRSGVLLDPAALWAVLAP